MPEIKKKILSVGNLLSLVRIVAAAVAVTVTVLVFYFTKEAKQEDRISDVSENLTKTTTVLTEHVKQADKTFTGIHETMREQRKVNEKTSTTLAEVTAVQRTIKEENGRLADTFEKHAEEVRKLADEVRKQNGGSPP
jgi:septal ring factor EnvC (AmiA/AmiB activator)